MELRTLAQIKNEIQNPLAIKDEIGTGLFIETDEFLRFINDGKDEAQGVVNELYQDYFLSNKPLQTIGDQSDYPLPDDCYEDKIRRIRYNDGSKKYDIAELNGQDKFDEYDNAESGDELKYMLVNVDGVRKIRFVPAPDFSNNRYISIWYWRQASDLVNDTDELEVPGAVRFVVEYGKGQCMAKENQGVVPPAQQAVIERARTKMMERLSDRTPDGQNEVEPDTTHYEESV